MVHRENPQLKRCRTKTQRQTSKCSYSTVVYLLKAVLLFPVLKNACFPALWFSVPGSRISQAAVYNTFSFVKAEPAASYCTTAQIQTCIFWNVLEMSSCPAKAIFRQRNNAVSFLCFSMSFCEIITSWIICVLLQNYHSSVLLFSRADELLWKQNYIKNKYRETEVDKCETKIYPAGGDKRPRKVKSALALWFYFCKNLGIQSYIPLLLLFFVSFLFIFVSLFLCERRSQVNEHKTPISQYQKPDSQIAEGILE